MIQLTSWQEQIVYGTLLGGGYICRSDPSYLGMSETRNYEWLHYKAQELESVGAKTPFSKSGNAVKWRSKSDTIFWDSYFGKFYSDGKKRVVVEVLHRLQDIALAVWYGDKGFWYSRRRIGLRTTAFGENNHLLWVYFNELDMPCDIRFDSQGAARIIFDPQGTNEFLATVAHRLPEFMAHRLSHKDTLLYS